jgi:peptidyl-prolyl cis-trans isomerase A (cyclophilin A)
LVLFFDNVNEIKRNHKEKKMGIFWLLFGLLFIGCSLIWPSGAENPHVLIKTELGDITIEIYEKDAPITAANFLKYVDEGLYKDGCFYRVVTMDNQPNNDIKIEVIQGGLSAETRGNMLSPIEHETTDNTGILHKNGVISMARSKPGTASSEFFICVGDQPELDFGGKRNPDGQGFSAFGRVVDGMDVVKKIHQQPTEEQMLVPRIKIFDIVRSK